MDIWHGGCVYVLFAKKFVDSLTYVTEIKDVVKFIGHHEYVSYGLVSKDNI